MEDSLEREVQVEGESPAPPESVMDAAVSALDEDIDASRLSPNVQELMLRMMEGVEPFGRPLKPWEMQKFSPKHINVCTLKAAGFKGKEIAQMVGLDQAIVSVVLNHPYGKKLLAVLVPKNSAHVLDIRTRLHDYASDLLDRVYIQTLVSDDVEQVAKVTFGLLDRAGFSPKAPAGDSKPGEVFGESTLKRLTAALDGSNSIDAHVMPTFVPRRPPEEGLLVESEVVGSSSPVAAQENGAAPPSDSQPAAPKVSS